MVPPGWYVTRAGARGGAGAGLLAGLEVNSLDTWDLARLGWLKVARGGRGLVSHNLGQLARSFQPSVDTCSGPAGARVRAADTALCLVLLILLNIFKQIRSRL